jgi:hypothetical protein
MADMYAVIGAGFLPADDLQQWQYLADNGTTHQLATKSKFGQAGAGDLTPAAGTEPVLPWTTTPRFMRVAADIGGVTTYHNVACNATNAAFLLGPGATVSIDGTTFTVKSCHGEDERE